LSFAYQVVFSVDTNALFLKVFFCHAGKACVASLKTLLGAASRVRIRVIVIRIVEPKTGT